MDGEPRQPTSMRTDNRAAEVIAQAVADMTANCRYVKLLQGSIRQEVEHVLLPFCERSMVVDCQGDGTKTGECACAVAVLAKDAHVLECCYECIRTGDRLRNTHECG